MSLLGGFIRFAIFHTGEGLCSRLKQIQVFGVRPSDGVLCCDRAVLVYFWDGSLVTSTFSNRIKHVRHSCCRVSLYFYPFSKHTHLVLYSIFHAIQGIVEELSDLGDGLTCAWAVKGQLLIR